LGAGARSWRRRLWRCLVALKKRKIVMKMTGPGTPEARGDIRVKL
jgi:hypothetical protein